MPLKIRSDSTEYVTGTITTDHDITGKVIDVAMPPSGTPAATWFPANVVKVEQTSANPPRWTATFRILVGPAAGVTSLAAGGYDWTVRVTDSPEVPVRKAGAITVTDI